jgi:hypothetical protein
MIAADIALWEEAINKRIERTRPRTHQREHWPNVCSCGRTGHAGMAGMT